MPKSFKPERRAAIKANRLTGAFYASVRTRRLAGNRFGDGSRNVDCYWYDNAGSLGTNVVIFTYPGDPRDFGHEVMTPDDNHRVIVGPDFVVSITGDWSKDGYSKHLTKAKLKSIADKVGGEVATG